MARHPTRRDGAIAVALFILPLAAMVLVRLYLHLDVGTMVTVMFGFAAVSLGLPTLWVTWAAYRGPRQGDSYASGLDLDLDLALALLTDQLAIALTSQWKTEAAIRRLNDPYPLPVAWMAADASLIDSWESLLKLATSGAGWPVPRAERTWADGPDDLAGEGGELADVLARVPTRRLVVLGEPGSGKTMLMVRLVLDLLATRTSGGPVPYLVSMASWNPVNQDLRYWLKDQLVIDHPSLAGLTSVGVIALMQAEALLDAGLILPLLDGLDEIPEEVRGPAISRINDALQRGEQMVLTCRTQQYRDAVRPEDGGGVTLRAAAAVELRPLDANAVRDYLCDDAVGLVAKARWEPVLGVIGTDTPTGQALTTPLMVGMARTIYNPRPGELAGALRDPSELCDSALADRTAVESLLFDAYIPAAYRGGDQIRRWKTQDIERWLVFLARHLERTIAYPDLAWWELRLTFPLLSIWTGLAAAIVVGSASGIAAAWIAGSAPVGVLIGLMLGGLAAGAITLKRSWEPTRDIRWKPPGFGVATIVVAVAMVAGILLGLLVYNRQGIAGPIAAWVLGSGSFLAIGFGIWLVVQEGTPLDMSSPSSPPIWLAMDRKMAILGAFIAGFGLLATVVLVVAVSSLIAGGEAAQAAVEALLLAAGPAVVVGIAACFKGAWAYYGIARTCLALRRRLPWHLMIFLSDAHERSVLRQVGALYQFRHIDLQHRLATRVPEVARIGSYSHFRDIGGEIYRVALMRIVDPAQGVDRLNVPDTGKRFVGAIFRIKARNGSLQGEDANNDVTVIGNNGESYRADVQEIAGYPKFDTAKLHVMQEGTATCAVTFQIPDDVKIEWAQWTTTSGFQPTVRWHAGQGQGIRRLWFASIARIGSVATSLYRRRNRMS